MSDVRLRLSLLGTRVREWLRFDFAPAQALAGWIGLAAGEGLFRAGRRLAGLKLLAAVHRSALSTSASRRVEAFLERLRGRGNAGGAAGLLARTCGDLVAAVAPQPHTRKFFAEPERLFVSSMMVLKSAREGERGVVVLHYSYLYPLVARLFDLDAILARYRLVLEPSWSGYCDPGILAYATLGRPVFVESIEPRDTAFVRQAAPLVPVPVAANWWIDHRVFRPLPGAVKDVDVCMVAGWGGYKRHQYFFAALRTLRRRGTRLRVLLLGYPLDRDREWVFRQARSFGVADQVELLEKLTPAEVNVHLNRSKAHVLWSRREGVNRAIIESMLAGVPTIVRAGMNFGHHYPHINDRTGRYATEGELPDRLLSMVDGHEAYAPREWVMEHMSAQHGTRILGDCIREAALAEGEPWTEDLAVKVSALDGLCYWDASDAARFREDYGFLRSAVRHRGTVTATD